MRTSGGRSLQAAVSGRPREYHVVSMWLEAEEHAVVLRVSAQVDHQSQVHEALPPLRCAHVRAHFGAQLVAY